MSVEEQAEVDRVREARRIQRQNALKKANEVRGRNKLVKDVLKAKKVSPEELIAGTVGDSDVAAALEAAIASWPLRRLVLAVPGIGDTRAQEVLSIFRASPRVVVSSLTYERRAELARLVQAARVG